MPLPHPVRSPSCRICGAATPDRSGSRCVPPPPIPHRADSVLAAPDHHRRSTAPDSAGHGTPAGDPCDARAVSSSRYAHVERERRFLVTEVPRVDASAGRTIADLYIHGTRLRLRRSEGLVAGRPDVVRKPTQKVPDPDAVGRRGTLTTIDLDEAEYARLALLPGRWITKRRLGEPPMGVDVFDGGPRPTPRRTAPSVGARLFRVLPNRCGGTAVHPASVGVPSSANADGFRFARRGTTTAPVTTVVSPPQIRPMWIGAPTDGPSGAAAVATEPARPHPPV